MESSKPGFILDLQGRNSTGGCPSSCASTAAVSMVHPRLGRIRLASAEEMPFRARNSSSQPLLPRPGSPFPPDSGSLVPCGGTHVASTAWESFHSFQVSANNIVANNETSFSLDITCLLFLLLWNPSFPSAGPQHLEDPTSNPRTSTDPHVR